MFLVTSVSFSSCSDKDGDEFMAPTGMDAGSAVSGTYAGELQVMGYTSSFRAFITLERMASDAVNLKIRCEDLDMYMEDVIMDVYSTGSSYSLSSNSKSKASIIFSNASFSVNLMVSLLLSIDKSLYLSGAFITSPFSSRDVSVIS